ncbi:MAG: hypothetical protein JXB49_23575 [Bacteroidales bacterium]|nr:hypothetical protein [Bacteroidales bacterium]
MKYYIITYFKRPIGESGESCNSLYDLRNACESCGTGAELIGNLRVKGFSNIKKDFFQTLDGDFIISKGILGLIKQIKPDLKLHPVIDSKNHILNFYHLNSSKVLPRFSVNSTGYETENQCVNCKRNGYFNSAIIGDLEKNVPTIVSPLCLIYKKNDFNLFSNNLILKTWECAGLSNKVAINNKVVRYARPWIIVNQTFKDILVNAKIEGINYEKIEIQ